MAKKNLAMAEEPLPSKRSVLMQKIAEGMKRGIDLAQVRQL